MSRLRALWARYMAWRVSGPAPPVADDGRPPLLKADVDTDQANRSSALGITFEGGS